MCNRRYFHSSSPPWHGFLFATARGAHVTRLYSPYSPECNGERTGDGDVVRGVAERRDDQWLAFPPGLSGPFPD